MPAQSRRRPSLMLRIVVAVVPVGLATLLAEYVMPLRERSLLLLYVAAVSIAAWRGGLGAALLAIGVSLLAIDYFFLPPLYSLGMGLADAINSLYFVLVAILISSLQTRKSRAEEALRTNEEEFRVAHQIQQHLFPSTPPDYPGYDVAGACYPASATGGDYFDYFPMRDGWLGVAVGDVTGHGFGPALLMAEVHACLRALVLTQADPGRILTLANRILCDATGDDRFVTVFFGCLDCPTGFFRYASAGQRGYLLDAAGAVTSLEGTGIPLGINPREVFRCAPTLTLQPGHLLLLLTDGVTEARSPRGDLFGLEATLQLVHKNRNRPARDLVEALCREVLAFSTPETRSDDVTVVVIKRLLPEEDRAGADTSTLHGV